jgi:hypothetical protein
LKKKPLGGSGSVLKLLENRYKCVEGPPEESGTHVPVAVGRTTDTSACVSIAPGLLAPLYS